MMVSTIDILPTELGECAPHVAHASTDVISQRRLGTLFQVPHAIHEAFVKPFVE